MEQLIYGGGYNSNGQRGLYAFRFDDREGELTPLQGGGAMTRNPSFAALEGGILYAVNELEGTGHVEAYRIDRASGGLTLLGAADLPGSATCHVTVWPGGKYLSCANYLSGSFAVLPTNGGLLGEPVYFEQHEGVGALSAGRQDGPHIHSTCISPKGRWLLAADLGLDWVQVFWIDPDAGGIWRGGGQSQIHTPGGEGPRHMAFSPDGRFLYLVTELANHCIVYAWDEEQGRAEQIQAADLLPTGFTGASKAADVHFSPDGRWLYCSNRGADTLAVFAVDPRSGLLEPAGNDPARGSFPRCFAVLPEHVLIANRHSNEITVCRRDAKTGRVMERTAGAPVPQAAFVISVGPMEGEAG